jgi:hypothetical protein
VHGEAGAVAFDVEDALAGLDIGVEGGGVAA